MTTSDPTTDSTTPSLTASRGSAALLALALAIAPTGIAQAAGPEPRSVEASLAVDTSEMGSAGPIVKQRILERGGQVFRDAHVLPADSADDPEVHLVVHEVGGEDPGFSFEITLRRAGQDASGDPWSVQCTLCTETELIDRVATELAKVASTLTVLAQSEPKPEPEARQDAEVESVKPSPNRSETPEDNRRAMHTLTKAGIGTLVGGVFAVGIGAGLAAAPPRVLPDNPLQERTTAPAGYAVLAVGATAVVAGVVLVALGVKRSRSSSVALAPGGFRWRF